MTVVDAHTHVFAAVSERFPRDVHELFPAEPEATAEALLAEMERAGVDRAVLVPLTHHDEYVRDCLERFPGRFAAIGVQPPGPIDVEGYRRRRERSGLQGLRLFALGETGVPSRRRAPAARGARAERRQALVLRRPRSRCSCSSARSSACRS